MSFAEWNHGYLWLALGMLLGMLELMLGTYYLLAFIGGALLTGLLALFLPMGWWWEVTMFAIYAIVSLWMLLHWRQETDGRAQPDDVSRMHGRAVEVLQRIAPRGRVRHRGVEWNAESDEVIEAGETAYIRDVRGSTLYVSKEVGK